MDFSYLFYAIARRSPMLFITVIASVVAAIRWRYHPKASLLVIVGMILYLFEALIFTVIYYFLPTLAVRLGLTVATDQWLYTAVYVVQDCVYALLIILLVSAALSNRSEAPLPD